LKKRKIQRTDANSEKLKRETAARRKAEKQLRASEGHYRALQTQARLMQENLRYLSCQILNIQEEEKKRISRELHDEVGAALTAVNMNLAVLKKAVRGNAGGLRRKIQDAQALLMQTMECVHNFSRELRPGMLDDLGLVPALRSYVKNFSERTHLAVLFDANPAVEAMETDQKTVFYRVAQEALTNMAKHAEATEGAISLKKFKGGMQLEIRDNGKAFRVDEKLSPDKKNKTNRLGLVGIQERVRLANGIFNVESFPGKGTRIRVWIPFRTRVVTNDGQAESLT